MNTALPLHVEHTLSGHVGRVTVGKYNKEGDYCVTGGADKMIKLWNCKTGICVKTYAGHGYEVLGIAISEDNTRFTSCGGEKAVLLWDVATATVLRRFSGHYQRINEVMFSKDAGLIYSGSYDSTVKIWDCRSTGFRPVQSMDQAKDSITSLQVTDKLIMSGSVDGHIRTYDVRNGMLTTDTVGRMLSSSLLIKDSVTSIRLSANLKCVLASSLDSTIRLFDRDNGQLLNEYKGHSNTNYRLTSTFDKQASHVISGSEDGKIYYWDIVSGKVVGIVNVHDKAVLSVAHHPKEDKVLSVSADGTGKILCVLS